MSGLILKSGYPVYGAWVNIIRMSIERLWEQEQICRDRRYGLEGYSRVETASRSSRLTPTLHTNDNTKPSNLEFPGERYSNHA